MNWKGYGKELSCPILSLPQHSPKETEEDENISVKMTGLCYIPLQIVGVEVARV
jgi:hypothetical protein